LPRHPGGTPFPERYRNVIESYLAVVISFMLVLGVTFMALGSAMLRQ
jgi:hypothetical protein